MLIWQELRSSGIMTLVFLVPSVLGGLVLVRSIPDASGVSGSLFAGFFATFGVAIAFGDIFADHGGRNSVPGPLRWRLPVSTWLLVATRMGTRALLILAYAALLRWALLSPHGVGPTWAAVALAVYWGLAAQLIVSMRTVVKGGDTLLIIFGGLLFITIPSGFSFGFMFINTEILSTTLLPAAVDPAALLLIPVSAFVVGCQIEKAGRRGAIVGLPEIAPLSALFAARGEQTTPFRSSRAALQWYHFRRALWLLPVLVPICWLFSSVFILFLQGTVGFRWTLLQGSVYMALSFGSMICGSFFSMRVVAGYSRDSIAAGPWRPKETSPSGSPIWRYLPISAADLAASHLHLNLRLLIPLLLSAFLLRNIPALLLGDPTAASALHYALSVETIGLREAVWYFIGPIAIVGVASWALLAADVKGIVQWSAIFLFMAGTFLKTSQAEVWVTSFALLLLWGWCLNTWRLAFRKCLVRGETAAWAFVLAALVTMLMSPTRDVLSSQTVLLALFIGALAILPYPLGLLAFDRARHEKGSVQAKSTLPPRWTGRRRGCTALALGATAVCVVWLKWPEEPPYVATWRAQGYPATLADLDAAYPPVPDDENAALYYVRAVEEVEKGRELPGLEARQEHLTQVVLPLLYTAASLDTVNSRYPVEFEELTDSTSRLEHHFFQDRLSQLAAELHTATILARRSEDAVESTLAIFALADSLAKEPLLASQIGRLKVIEEAVDAVEICLRSTLTSDQLARLQQALADAIPPDGVLARGYAGERVIDLLRKEHATPWQDGVQGAIEKLLAGDTLRKAHVIAAYGNALEVLSAGPGSPQQIVYSPLSRNERDIAEHLTVEWAEIPQREWHTRARVQAALVAVERYRISLDGREGAPNA
jgi:hypothetical protein